MSEKLLNVLKKKNQANQSSLTVRVTCMCLGSTLRNRFHCCIYHALENQANMLIMKHIQVFDLSHMQKVYFRMRANYTSAFPTEVLDVLFKCQKAFAITAKCFNEQILYRITEMSRPRQFDLHFSQSLYLWVLYVNTMQCCSLCCWTRLQTNVCRSDRKKLFYFDHPFISGSCPCVYYEKKCLKVVNLFRLLDYNLVLDFIQCFKCLLHVCTPQYMVNKEFSTIL